MDRQAGTSPALFNRGDGIFYPYHGDSINQVHDRGYFSSDRHSGGDDDLELSRTLMPKCFLNQFRLS